MNRTIALILLAEASAFAQEVLPPPTPTDSYSIIYTGRTFGNFRMPELQMADSNNCPRQPETGSAAAEFQKAMQTLAPDQGTTVRVTAGDNFAPFLLAREMWTKDPKDPNDLRKGHFEQKGSHEGQSADPSTETYRNYTLGRATITADNVACFLWRMQFDALVPGYHDFYFGPERLREVARLLHEMSVRENSPDCKKTKEGCRETRLLGANLVLHTRAIDVNQPGGVGVEKSPPKPTGPGFADNGKPHVNNVDEDLAANPPSAALPKVVLPWMRAVRIKNAFKRVVTRGGQESPSPRLDLMAAESQGLFQQPTRDRQPTEPTTPAAQFRDWLATFPDPTPITIKLSKAPNEELPAEHTLTAKLKGVCIVKGDPPESAPPCVKGDPFTLKPAQDNDFGTDDAEYELTAGQSLLVPGDAYSMCLVASAERWSCSPFKVSPTFFEYPRTADEIQSDASLKPWILRAAADGGLPVAIFGVVDVDLMQSVGRLKYTWLGDRRKGGHYVTDDSYETVVQAAQPGESLKQALRYCLQEDACKYAHKVLLAQMPEQDAYDAVGQLQTLKGLPMEARFEVIIAGADASRASGDQIIVRRKPAKREFGQPVVLVPGLHVPTDDPYRLRVRLQRAVVTPTTATSEPEAAERRLIRNSVIEGEFFDVNPLDPIKRWPAGQTSPTSTLMARLKQRQNLIELTDLAPVLAKGQNPTDQQATRGLEQIALRVMREACHSDAAFLQHRDIFYTAKRASPQDFFTASLDESWTIGLIDAILWKGDFIQCMQVTGDTISGLLQRSKELQEDEDNGIETDFSRGWALATLGVDENEVEKSNRLINGQYIDPKKLYSIAITDYLANGDTGYPVLQNAEPVPMDRWSETKFRTLGAAIATEVISGKLPSREKAAEYLDLADHIAPQLKEQPGFVAWWKGLRQSDTLGLIPAIERYAQEKTIWSISLYKADASFALFYHNGNESQLGQRFPGITAVDLSSPNTQAIAFDYMLRVQRSANKWIAYLESDLNYGHKANRTPQNVYQRSQTADYYYNELGIAKRIFPNHQSASGLKLLLPVAFRTQLWPPITQITPGADSKPPKTEPPTSPSKAIASQSAINYFPSFRPGLRYDYVKPKPDTGAAGGPAPGQGGGKGQPGQIQTSQLWTSFIELGYEAGRVFNGPSEFDFYSQAGGKMPCYVSDISCVLNLPVLSPPDKYTIQVINGRNHTQTGFYADFRIDMPLPHLRGLEFVAENRGDFYMFGAPHDTPVDTRFNNDAKAALIVPIPGTNNKLSLSPTFEWIVFRNKGGPTLLPNTYYAVNTFVSLSYSFDWHQGLEWKRVLGFNNPVPALQAPPAR